MAEGFSRSPKLLKGALVQFSAPLLVPIPNIIIFQYNPESISRTLQPFEPAAAPRRSAEGGEAEAGADQQEPPASPSLVQPGDPGETLSLSLLLDATDALEEPEGHPVAVLTGVADRLAALEMLLYPAGSGLLGSLSIDVSVSVGADGFSMGGSAEVAATEEPGKVPIVLFVWGPGRIVPVRITGFTVEEVQYNQLLYPHRAKVALTMAVRTSKELEGDTRTEAEIARFAYDFTKGQKELLALANVANTVESILGMLPF